MKTERFEAVVVGTGAAGYSCAAQLKKMHKRVCIVTDGIYRGTSRNTGSDKQTYYKLSLAGSYPDSVQQMAQNLFDGGAVDGDNALCEAALSTGCFLNLCACGVPFPKNLYGEYVGYQTDHDTHARATSAGPLTSKFMTEALEREAEKLDIPRFDAYLAVQILTHDNMCCGLLAMHTKSGELLCIHSPNVVLATGGPASIYANSVYPKSQYGMSSLALLAGAHMQNLTEWQYGLSSVSPRWNVSGTYMQALPRFLSVDEDGIEREFLTDYFENPYDALSMVFLKGYQWPFDSRKAQYGSSRIDLAVYTETILKRRKVYLDFTKNPFGLATIDYQKLCAEAYTYLQKNEALFGTPKERLEHMNAPALLFYRTRGVDLETDHLQIALCAQHANGGIAVNAWWETKVKGLFAIGECAGTHGVYRPGGSALNAGQVGAFRAAEYIATAKDVQKSDTAFTLCAKAAEQRHKNFLKALLSPAEDTPKTMLETIQSQMSACAAAVRQTENMRALLSQNQKRLQHLAQLVVATTPKEIAMAYRLQDALYIQNAVLTAMLDYSKRVGTSRGSALYCEKEEQLQTNRNDTFIEKQAEKSFAFVQEVYYQNKICSTKWRPVRPIPQTDEPFEATWRTYRENKNI